MSAWHLALALSLAALGCRAGTSPAPKPGAAAATSHPSGAPAAPSTTQETMLTDAQLIDLARAAARGIDLAPAAPPTLTRADARCTVRFPVPPPGPDDLPSLGPDYLAEVDLECATGKTLAVRVGS